MKCILEKCINNAWNKTKTSFLHCHFPQNLMFFERDLSKLTQKVPKKKWNEESLKIRGKFIKICLNFNVNKSRKFNNFTHIHQCHDKCDCRYSKSNRFHICTFYFHENSGRCCCNFHYFRRTRRRQCMINCFCRAQNLRSICSGSFLRNLCRSVGNCNKDKTTTKKTQFWWCRNFISFKITLHSASRIRRCHDNHVHQSLKRSLCDWK